MYYQSYQVSSRYSVEELSMNDDMYLGGWNLVLCGLACRATVQALITDL